MKSPASEMAKTLRRNAFTGLGLAVLLIGVAPFLRPLHDLAFWLIWPLLLASMLIVLGIAAHLLFDAALFQLIASGSDEKTALAELDTLLDRMGLRAKQAAIRPLAQRMAGSRRIVSRLRFFLGMGLALFVLLAILPPGAEL